MLGLAVSYGVHAVLSNHTYKVGDVMYLQSSGGPIGLELTGAVARPFMLRWDRLYLEKVKKVGMKMPLYKRYIDDSNQMAVVPPPGAKYDETRNKVVVDMNTSIPDENEDTRLARVLKEIANTVMQGIQMEEDNPSKNKDKKMPILDMKVWVDEHDGYIVYQHYEKSMATMKIMHAQ